MANKSRKDGFDPQHFLAKVGVGKAISKYKKDQIVFSQGEMADTVFYIQKGRVKVVVLSDQGKEAVVGILEAGILAHWAIFVARLALGPKGILAKTSNP